MTNNEILRLLRTAIDLQDDTLINIFKQSDFSLSKSQLKAILKKESAPGFVKCKDAMMVAFLDGLILFKRGPADNAPDKKVDAKNPYLRLSNNTILKKLRIAFKFQDADMIKTFQLAGLTINKGEMSSWFRKQGHKNYKPCNDESLIKFITGLGIQFGNK